MTPFTSARESANQKARPKLLSLPEEPSPRGYSGFTDFIATKRRKRAQKSAVLIQVGGYGFP
jgi:hypothetical protein